MRSDAPQSGDPQGLLDLNFVGIPDQPLRLTIRRLIATGDVTQAGRGRAGTLTLTPNGRHRLERDRSSLALAFAQDAGALPGIDAGD